MELPQDAQHYHLQIMYRTVQPIYLLELIIDRKPNSKFIRTMKIIRFPKVILFTRIFAPTFAVA